MACHQNNNTYLIQVTPDDRENYETYTVRTTVEDAQKRTDKFDEIEVDEKLDLLKAHMAYMFREFQIWRCNKLAQGKTFKSFQHQEVGENNKNIEYLEKWIHAMANAYNELCENDE